MKLVTPLLSEEQVALVIKGATVATNRKLTSARPRPLAAGIDPVDGRPYLNAIYGVTDRTGITLYAAKPKIPPF